MPWQHAPPAHGSSFAEYDTSQTTVVEGTQHTITTQLWLDQQTALPLREDTLDNGSVTEDQYFDYDRQRTSISAYPSDEFSVSQPTNLGQSRSETISNDSTPAPDKPPPSEQDRMTEATAFRASLGCRPTRELCKASLTTRLTMRASTSSELHCHRLSSQT
jgi:hypothetical protein